MPCCYVARFSNLPGCLPLGAPLLGAAASRSEELYRLAVVPEPHDARGVPAAGAGPARGHLDHEWPDNGKVHRSLMKGERVVDIKALRALAPPSLRPRSQAITPPAPHAASPLERAGTADLRNPATPANSRRAKATITPSGGGRRSPHSCPRPRDIICQTRTLAAPRNPRAPRNRRSPMPQRPICSGPSSACVSTSARGSLTVNTQSYVSVPNPSVLRMARLGRLSAEVAASWVTRRGGCRCTAPWGARDGVTRPAHSPGQRGADRGATSGEVG